MIISFSVACLLRPEFEFKLKILKVRNNHDILTQEPGRVTVHISKLLVLIILFIS